MARHFLAFLLLAVALTAALPRPGAAAVSGSGCCGAYCGSGCIDGCNDCATACGYNPCSNGASLVITSCQVLPNCNGQPAFSIGGGGSGGGSSGGGSGATAVNGSLLAAPPNALRGGNFAGRFDFGRFDVFTGEGAAFFSTHGNSSFADWRQDSEARFAAYLARNRLFKDKHLVEFPNGEVSKNAEGWRDLFAGKNAAKAATPAPSKNVPPALPPLGQQPTPAATAAAQDNYLKEAAVPFLRNANAKEPEEIRPNMYPAPEATETHESVVAKFAEHLGVHGLAEVVEHGVGAAGAEGAATVAGPGVILVGAVIEDYYEQKEKVQKENEWGEQSAEYGKLRQEEAEKKFGKGKK